MLREISENQYFPTVCLRTAEMRGLEELPESTKDILFPIVPLAPWGVSKSFDRSAERIYKAFGNRPIIADLDRVYRSTSEREASEHFRTLLDPSRNYSNWVDYIENHQSFVPVVQTTEISEQGVLAQSSALAELGRGRAYRLNLDLYPPISLIRRCLEQEDNRDLIVIIDGGWSDNSEFVAAQILGAITALADAVDDLPVVIVSSSFPNDFTDIEGLESLPIGARSVFELVRARRNDLRLLYGDWSSTKPRKYDGFGSLPRPRVDYPTKRRWILSRNEKDDSSYTVAARRITNIPEWADRPNIWGSYMIEKTAKGGVAGITTYQQAMAARINLHLFTQAHYSADIPMLSTDEPWSDI